MSFLLHRKNSATNFGKDLKGLTALPVDPGGFLDSRAFAGPHVPKAWQIMLTVLYWLRPILKQFLPSLRVSAEAAQGIVDYAVSPKLGGQGPYVEVNKRVDSSPESVDERVGYLQDAVWDKSLEWCKITQKDTVLPL